jgi:uncharacterized repeat protein (TIGR03803 family)
LRLSPSFTGKKLPCFAEGGMAKVLSFCSARNRVLSDYLTLPTPTAGRSAGRLFASLGKGTLLLVFFLLAACGGGGGSGSGGGAGGGGGSGVSPVVLVSISVGPYNPTVELGASLKMEATGTYSDGTMRDLSASASWTSSDTGVATVAPGGIVSAVAGGPTTITATFGGIPASQTVTVQSAVVTYIHALGVGPIDPSQPKGPLLQASDGNFYGTTAAGGGYRCFDVDNFCGTIFRLTPDGTATVMHAFRGPPSDGWSPTGPLIQGRDGALYGLTTQGGAYDFGTFYKITLDGAYTVLHSFGASPSGGKQPLGSLVEASDGNFYGTTSSGGGAVHCTTHPMSECGTIFRITPAGQHTVLHTFGSTPGDGATPNGSLIQTSDGNFYGTTAVGGDLSCLPFAQTFPPIYGCGTVFRMTPAGAVTILHSFGASSSDGILPDGPLVPGGDGAFYGTTRGGGQPLGCGETSGCGTVFRITPAGAVTILYAFAKANFDGPPPPVDGYHPAPFLLRARDGNFYGLTSSVSGASTVRTGTVFRITPSGVKTTLYTFGAHGDGPTHPVWGLIQGADDAFYGLTAYDGGLGGTGNERGSGTVFRMVVP